LKNRGFQLNILVDLPPWELPKSNLNLLGYEQTMNSS